MVGDVDRSVNTFKTDKIPLNPFTKSNVFDINMSSPCCGLLSIAHGRTSIVVLICNGGSLLWNIKIPQDATDKKGHASNIASCHEFHLCRRECHGWLELCFVSYGAAGELDTDTAEQTTGLNACGPVGVPICNSNIGIVMGAGVK